MHTTPPPRPCQRTELGFNIRGGQYGHGIFVSQVCPGTQAEETGMRVGDQLLEVNGVDFAEIAHLDAVKTLQRVSHIVLTLK